MKKLSESKSRSLVFLVSAIVVLCVAFVVINCGSGPQMKIADPYRGHFAVDLTDCTDDGGSSVSGCGVSFTSATFTSSETSSKYSIQGKEFTMEAWAMPKSTSTSYIFTRMGARGAGLGVKPIVKISASCNAATPTVFTFTAAHGFTVGQKLNATVLAGCGIAATDYYVCSVPSATTMTVDDDAGCGSTVGGQAGSALGITWSAPDNVTPTFTIKRVVESILNSAGTSTVTYTVSSSASIARNAWSHIAGMLVNKDHSGSDGCTGPHIDILVNGVNKGCATTLGGTSADGDIDNAANNDNSSGKLGADLSGIMGYAHNPADGSIGSSFQGAIDEARLWTNDRTAYITTCKDVELAYNSGVCGRVDTGLIAYMRFNEGEGHSVTDLAGLGSGGKEYKEVNVGDCPPEGWCEWNTGWTSNVPTLTSAD